MSKIQIAKSKNESLKKHVNKKNYYRCNIIFFLDHRSVNLFALFFLFLRSCLCGSMATNWWSLNSWHLKMVNGEVNKNVVPTFPSRVNGWKILVLLKAQIFKQVLHKKSRLRCSVEKVSWSCRPEIVQEVFSRISSFVEKMEVHLSRNFDCTLRSPSTHINVIKSERRLAK